MHYFQIFKFLAKHIFSDVFQFYTHISHLISIKILTFSLPYTVRDLASQKSKSQDKLRPSWLQVQDHSVLSRQRLATQICKVYLETPSHTLFPSIHATVTKTSRQPRCIHSCPRHYPFASYSPHLSMTFTCINITLVLTRKVAVSIPFTHPIQTLYSTSRNTFPNQSDHLPPLY